MLFSRHMGVEEMPLRTKVFHSRDRATVSTLQVRAFLHSAMRVLGSIFWCKPVYKALSFYVGIVEDELESISGKNNA